MSLSFEHRRDAVHEGILSGSVGCPFAKLAAEQGEIAYCASPDTINAGKINMPYINAIQEFAYDKAKSVLITLPEKNDVITEDDARLYAKQLFPETVSSMQFATQNLLDELLAEPEEHDDDLYELMEMRPVQDRETIFDFWRHFSDKLRKKFPEGTGVVVPHLLRRKSRIFEPMFTFAMDPTYKPLTALPHPRYSPHFAQIINYRNDLQNLATTNPKVYAATKNWIQAAVGYEYSEGYRISQRPTKYNPDESKAE